MSDVAPLIRTRLENEVTALKEVCGALDFSAIKGSAVKFPAAFIFLQGDSASANNIAVGGHRQKLTGEIAVVLVLKSANDRSGEKASDELEELRSAVRAALVGWEPGNGFEPLSLKRGRLLGFSKGVAFWQDTYEAGSEIRV